MYKLHDPDTVKKHANLLADFATVKGWHAAYATAIDNPYGILLREAEAKLPKKASLLALRKADKLLEEEGKAKYSGYLTLNYPVHIVTPREAQA